MSTLEKYKRVTKDKDSTPENEIRITTKGGINTYISYGAKQLLEKKLKSIVLKASGAAISKVCIVTEILRHRIKGLSQITRISNIEIKDEYQPLEEGLDVVIVSRILAVLEVVLTTEPTQEEINHYGYQPCLPEEEIKEFPLNYGNRTGGGNRPRGDWDKEREGGRGRGRGGRGRGRGGRGSSRGRGRRGNNRGGWNDERSGDRKNYDRSGDNTRNYDNNKKYEDRKKRYDGEEKRPYDGEKRYNDKKRNYNYKNNEGGYDNQKREYKNYGENKGYGDNREYKNYGEHKTYGENKNYGSDNREGKSRGGGSYRSRGERKF